MRMATYPITKRRAAERTAKKTIRYLTVSVIAGTSSIITSVFVTLEMMGSTLSVPLSGIMLSEPLSLVLSPLVLSSVLFPGSGLPF